MPHPLQAASSINVTRSVNWALDEDEEEPGQLEPNTSQGRQPVGYRHSPIGLHPHRAPSPPSPRNYDNYRSSECTREGESPYPPLLFARQPLPLLPLWLPDHPPLAVIFIYEKR
ncbi:hypothetical protein GALMADRAFT_147935 [Galerina marginata CBS 339.88]|uniref:Uncharacterized protein n=1 Tax=Galerina marginata (strain CBS 339.88) TaxID=685588 RepID=A0A067S686_GALM3|nr:hypothetical protein GALMADRAFT_147935 [Galerina marginata CBS 339.88]